ncbi:thioesterase family protein [Actinomadura rupiterrae]|uniref:thioesterase family protein n=1 Tax=Actinomadura rupiterrae TaxID=559627 RepID=UPI0020A560AB|nr:thioesterase family protein [Actinomadura rupiterrae]MCP2340983.1 hypothetical protein [Actinomadura rupiterrae]
MLVEARFHGPDNSGNGGYVAGLLASEVAAEVTRVALRLPPPLETELRVTDEDGARGHLKLWDGENLVAEARSDAFSVEPVPAVAPEAATRAAEKFNAGGDHPFPRCFVCGPERAHGDGMRLAPGPVDGLDGTVACTWTPWNDPTPALVWAALDCPGGWAFDPAGSRPAVLGTMTAQVHRLPEAGEPCVAVGVARARQGRKMFAGSAVYGADGTLVGRAEQIWVEVDPARFGG